MSPCVQWPRAPTTPPIICCSHSRSRCLPVPADFGNAHWRGNTGSGTTGPWVGADLEAGMYYGGGSETKVNNQSQPLPFDFVSLVLKGWADGFQLKGGDATRGKQTIMYNGSRPFQPGSPGRKHHYQPMRKQGAIILATGGDNSNSARGNFYEGFMATGLASKATDEAIQANIVGVGYSGWNAPA